MTDQIKGVLIDPIEKKIHIKYFPAGSGFLNAVYKALNCSTITTGGYVTRTDVIYVDDEGLLKNHFDENGKETYLPGFYCEEWNGGPLVGKGVIVGTNNAGETVSVSEAGIQRLYAMCNAKKFRWAKVDTGAEEFHLE